VSEPWLLVDLVPAEDGGEVALPTAEARHALSVLRLGPGDPLVLADGRGGLARGRVASAGRGALSVAVERVERVPRPAPSVTVALAVLHTKAMDWAVQKCVEVGAERFVPVVAARSQLGAGAAAGRLGHWRRVALQAIKQCRRPWAMEVAEPVSLDALASGPPGFLADAAGAPVLAVPHSLPATLLVGPEGGLTPTEAGLLDRAGWTPVRLGPNVLRAETAAVVGAACLLASTEVTGAV